MAVSRLSTSRLTQATPKFNNFNQLTLPYVTDNLQLLLDANNITSYPGTGSTWYDLSKNNYSGTLTNSPTWNSAGYFSFDGTNDYVNFGDVLDPGTNSWSISILTYPLANAPSGNNTFMVSKAVNGASNYRYGLGVTANTTIPRAFIEPTSGTAILSVGSTNMGINSWSFITAVYNRSGNLSIYKNETLVSAADISSASGQNFNTNHPFRVGAYTDPDNTTPLLFYNGRISLVSVHFKALTTAEINQNFNAVRGRYGI
jgi:hypothetical protein